MNCIVDPLAYPLPRPTEPQLPLGAPA
jgi:hypothetical protein